MPLITAFKRSATNKGKVQPTEVEATYKIVEVEDGKSFFQIDTGGSASRENPGKQSQTFQLSRTSAEALWRLLGQHYGFKG